MPERNGFWSSCVRGHGLRELDNWCIVAVGRWLRDANCRDLFQGRRLFGLGWQYSLLALGELDQVRCIVVLHGSIGR